SGRAGQHPQPAGRPPRGGPSPGGRPGAASRRLPRGADPAPFGRVEVSGSRPAHGPHPRQRGKTVGPRLASPAPFARRSLMSQSTVLAPAANPPSADDPRVTGALREYLAALEAGRQPHRDAFLARHADVAEALAEGLAGLEFIHGAAPH